MGSLVIALFLFGSAFGLMAFADKLSKHVDYKRQRKLMGSVPEDRRVIQAEYKCFRGSCAGCVQIGSGEEEC